MRKFAKLIPLDVRRQVANQPWSGSNTVKLEVDGREISCCPIGYALCAIRQTHHEWVGAYEGLPGSIAVVGYIASHPDQFEHTELLGETEQDADKLADTIWSFMREFDQGKLDAENIARAFGVKRMITDPV